MVIGAEKGNIIPVDEELAAGMAADVAAFLHRQAVAGAGPAAQIETGYPETPALYDGEAAETDPPNEEERAEAGAQTAVRLLGPDATVRIRRPTGAKPKRAPQPTRAPRHRLTTPRLRAAADTRPDLKPFPYGSGE